MTEDNQTSILVSIITGVFLIFSTIKSNLFSSILKGIKNIRLGQKKDKFLESLRKMYEIYSVIDAIGYETGADRVILFSGHNCGGVPEVFKPYTVSGLYSVGVPKEIFDNYKNLGVDSFYVDALLKASGQCCFFIDADKMPDCQLKTYYDLEGVKEAYIFYIDIIENNLIYMSVASKHLGGITKNDKTFISLQVNKIKNLLQK